MNSGRLILAVIVLLAVGIIALPSTVSLFAGQHDWYNIDASGNQIPCQKCHADVYEELNKSDFHIRWGNSNKADEDDCRGCHQGNTSITFANGTANSGGDYAHAASKISCYYCHVTNYTTVSAPYAGGFGYGVLANDTGTKAAHGDFVDFADTNGNIFNGPDEACIACHTHVAVKINFSHYQALKFDVKVDNPQTGVFNVTNFSINMTLVKYNTIWGNVSGNGSTTYNSNNWPGNW